ELTTMVELRSTQLTSQRSARAPHVVSQRAEGDVGPTVGVDVVHVEGDDGLLGVEQGVRREVLCAIVFEPAETWWAIAHRQYAVAHQIPEHEVEVAVAVEVRGAHRIGGGDTQDVMPDEVPIAIFEPCQTVLFGER